MACSGCAARREWFNKMTRLAHERAVQLFRSNPEDESERGRASDSDGPVSADLGATPEDGGQPGAIG
ncbi:hypothetical protein EUX58_02170 [Pseudomonas sp. 770NI]|nr:hypothetical protein EUX58_02170 [Pseudomonas sp. 770NI]